MKRKQKKWKESEQSETNRSWSDLVRNTVISYLILSHLILYKLFIYERHIVKLHTSGDVGTTAIIILLGPNSSFSLSFSLSFSALVSLSFPSFFASFSHSNCCVSGFWSVSRGFAHSPISSSRLVEVDSASLAASSNLTPGKWHQILDTENILHVPNRVTTHKINHLHILLNLDYRTNLKSTLIINLFTYFISNLNLNLTQQSNLRSIVYLWSYHYFPSFCLGS